MSMQHFTIFCYPLLSSFLYITQEIMKLGLDFLDVDEWQHSFVCFAFSPCLFLQCESVILHMAVII